MIARALTLEEVTAIRADYRSPLPHGGCRKCGGERQNEYAAYCRVCATTRLADFMRSNVLYPPFRGVR